MHALLTYFYHFTSPCKLWRKITCISIFGFIFINLYVLFYCINISCMYWEYKLRNICYSTTRKISHMNSLISLYLLEDILFFRLRLNIPIFQPILGWKKLLRAFNFRLYCMAFPFHLCSRSGLALKLFWC